MTQTPDTPDTPQQAINTIRTLSMDAVEAAGSGNPGTAMTMVPVVYQLWNHHLNFNPDDPIWPNRDRFVLSIGHASMMIYSLLHLAQVKAVNEKYEQLGELSVTLDDIRKFRQLDSKCPGHPEYRWARVWRAVWAWLFPAGGWDRRSIGPASRCPATTSTHSAATGA